MFAVPPLFSLLLSHWWLYMTNMLRRLIRFNQLINLWHAWCWWWVYLVLLYVPYTVYGMLGALAIHSSPVEVELYELVGRIQVATAEGGRVLRLHAHLGYIKNTQNEHRLTFCISWLQIGLQDRGKVRTLCLLSESPVFSLENIKKIRTQRLLTWVSGVLYAHGFGHLLVALEDEWGPGGVEDGTQTQQGHWGLHRPTTYWEVTRPVGRPCNTDTVTLL